MEILRAMFNLDISWAFKVLEFLRTKFRMMCLIFFYIANFTEAADLLVNYYYSSLSPQLRGLRRLVAQIRAFSTPMWSVAEPGTVRDWLNQIEAF